jgi:hypothetical protein
MTTKKAASSTASRAIQPHNHELITEFHETLERINMTAKDFAKASGVSETIISPWQQGKYVGDVAGVEGKIAAALQRIRATGKLCREIVETPMTVLLLKVAVALTQTGLVGMLHGAHGTGKSTAAVYLSIKDPTAIVLRVTRWNNSVAGVERLLMAFFSTAAWQRSQKCRGDFLVANLVGTRRLVVVDGADNLTVAAKHWLLDLAEQTGGALLFICGPKAGRTHGFLADARTQEAVSMAIEATFNASENEATARAVLGKFPAWLPSLTGIVASRGIGRAVAVASLASAMVTAGKDAGRALEDAAVNCGCVVSGGNLAIEG